MPALLLLIFFLGKLMMSLRGASYEAGIQVFSMVTLQVHLAIIWPAFGRRFKGYSLWQGIQLGVMIAVVSQVLIMFGTGLSYVIGDTHFNTPVALNQEAAVGFLQAMLIRASGLVGNSVICTVAAIIGWTMGALIPERDTAGS